MAENMPEKLDAAYTKGWNDAEEVLRREMADVLERSGAERATLGARIEQMTKALESVDKQTPDAIGGEPYVISPGALYEVRAALYGSGGPRPKDDVPEGGGHYKGEGDD